MAISVALVNDYEVIVAGLAAGLRPFADRVQVVELNVGDEPRRQADLALFDTFASRQDSLHRARKMVEDDVVGDVVLYTWDASSRLIELADDIGVAAVLLKTQPMSVVVETLENVAKGNTGAPTRVRRGRSTMQPNELSERELEVLALVSAGLSNREIAEQLFVSVNTVKTHIARLYRRLGVRNRVEAASIAAEHRLGPPPRRRPPGD